MKYHIDTIPVIDAFDDSSECPICIIEKKCEKQYVESFLGGSVMSPETRVLVNEHGFCPEHYAMLYAEKNRLGLALMTHTYMRETTKQLQKLAEKFPKAQAKSSLFSGSKNYNSKSIDDFCSYIDQKIDDCVVCSKLGKAVDRYIYTMLHLFKNSNEFRIKIDNSCGLCLPHLRRSILMAKNEFSQTDCAQWLETILPIEFKALQRLDEELDWFIKKFDYRYRQEPWGTSQDSLIRAMHKMTGRKFE